MLDVLERNILRRIFDPVKDRDQWRCRFNGEFYGLFKVPILSVVIRVARLQWAGHVAGINEIFIPITLTYMQPEKL
jgi:hypothetical protein